MNPFEFVLAILVVTGIFSLLKHRMGARRGSEQEPSGDTHEAARLRDEVRELKERLKVLERITVEKENSLANEIEELRDR